ncbi:MULTISPECIES: hypothetical protein [unclassified Bradyrhizobium]|uniref:hypothetical protein n=1 Tax=unclassified Bradyrhizobium TaxID=2631580 RepID=UPI001FFB583E|nr:MULTISPECIES: hypothetical protein [unclassified Bradyrhizobium]MCK1271077.1 hypothetical protein [Bradyrhizobium sp. 84]MCK1375396.1 hypothetical protein [Bradyrhizobium sp. 49]MCK1418466.1 hypothetical protein [Bradyrhizobium sp. CW4]MCK1426752.1 hypothetical protein [Bradyrhizobium sp. 87]UPJ81923.1 hypothetical protein IVB17_08145 [Bradyrhizobium sp. 184]
MGIERMHSAKYWRARAEEFRAKADNCEYPETRDALRSVAKNYDDLARSAEQIGRTAEARLVAEEYANDQRGLQQKLRHKMN